MAEDTELVYSLELRILDLERAVGRLAERLDAVTRQAPTVPDAAARRIEAGEAPVRVLRECRMMTQKELSEASGVRANRISAIERGDPLSTRTAQQLARALRVPSAVLMTPSSPSEA